MLFDEKNDEYVVRFTADEALVLHDWIYRLESGEESVGGLDPDDAVWAPLHRIGAALDKTLVAIFQPDYLEQVDAAKARLKKRMDF
ncbi:hypothetical protein [Kibdelosporangium aridum]|uniref:hypothetical protein n=1 Tax=Kibdelosporangium aridum TaxID=2030 RepID=UPI000526FE4E